MKLLSSIQIHLHSVHFQWIDLLLYLAFSLFLYS